MGKTLYLAVSTIKAKEPFAQAKKLLAENVTITGDEYERGGLHAIVAKSVAKD